MDSAYGLMYGELIGDSLGLRYEFKEAQIVGQLIQNDLDSNGFLPILGGGVHKLEPGQLSDDSEMALCLARSLVACDGFDIHDVACSYCYWMMSGPMCAGRTTRNALPSNASTKNMPENWREALTQEEKAQIYNQIETKVNQENQNSLSNGALMRVSPLAIKFRDDPQLGMYARNEASITHTSDVIKNASEVYVTALAALLKGSSNEDAYEAAMKVVKNDDVRKICLAARTHTGKFLINETNSNGDDSFQGYYGIALQNAFYQLLHATSFYEGLLNTIKIGGDTDTNGAIAGSLLGARFGIKGIPEEWVKMVKNAEPVQKSRKNKRKNMDLAFLSAKDLDELVENICK